MNNWEKFQKLDKEVKKLAKDRYYSVLVEKIRYEGRKIEWNWRGYIDLPIGCANSCNKTSPKQVLNELKKKLIARREL